MDRRYSDPDNASAGLQNEQRTSVRSEDTVFSYRRKGYQENISWNQVVSFVKILAKGNGRVIAMIGVIDHVSEANTCDVIFNGRKDMSRISGTG